MRPDLVLGVYSGTSDSAALSGALKVQSLRDRKSSLTEENVRGRARIERVAVGKPESGTIGKAQQIIAHDEGL